MSRVPTLARRVLDELTPRIPSSGAGRTVDASMIERAFITLRADMDRLAAVLADLDRLASEPAGGTTARSLVQARAREAWCAGDVAATAASLLLAPATNRGDLIVKLVVLIAASEPASGDAQAFPGLYLRALLADFASAR